MLYKAEIDLIIYDSSELQSTKEIIDKYNKYNNLYYKKINSKISSNKKFLKLLLILMGNMNMYGLVMTIRFLMSQH